MLLIFYLMSPSVDKLIRMMPDCLSGALVHSYKIYLYVVSILILGQLGRMIRLRLLNQASCEIISCNQAQLLFEG